MKRNSVFRVNYIRISGTSNLIGAKKACRKIAHTRRKIHAEFSTGKTPTPKWGEILALSRVYDDRSDKRDKLPLPGNEPGEKSRYFQIYAYFRVHIQDIHRNLREKRGYNSRVWRWAWNMRGNTFWATYTRPSMDSGGKRWFSASFFKMEL